MKEIVSKAPYRIDLCGGPTDVIDFANRDIGYVVSLAINRYSTSSLKIGHGHSLILRSKDYGVEEIFKEKPTSIDQAKRETQLLLACALIEGFTDGLEIATKSYFVPNSGLGGSAALAVSLIGSLKRIKNQKVKPEQLAKLALDVENNLLKNTAGGQDQYCSAFGGVSLFSFKGDQIDRDEITVRKPLRELLSNSLLICGPFGNHSSGQILTNVIEKFYGGNQTVKASLATLRQLAKSIPDIISAGNIKSLGETLHDGWLAQRKLSHLIPNREFDELLDRKSEFGILGGKLAGAGGGGYGILVVNPEMKVKTMNRLNAHNIKCESITVDYNGFSVF